MLYKDIMIDRLSLLTHLNYLKWERQRLCIYDVIYETYGCKGIHICLEKPYLYVQGCKLNRIIELNNLKYLKIKNDIKLYLLNQLIKLQYETFMLRLK